MQASLQLRVRIDDFACPVRLTNELYLVFVWDCRHIIPFAVRFGECFIVYRRSTTDDHAGTQGTLSATAISLPTPAGQP